MSSWNFRDFLGPRLFFFSFFCVCGTGTAINARDSVWSGRYGCELVGPKSGIRAGVHCRGARTESHRWLHLIGSRLGLEAHYLDPLMMPKLAPVLIICCVTAL